MEIDREGLSVYLQNTERSFDEQVLMQDFSVTVPTWLLGTFNVT